MKSISLTESEATLRQLLLDTSDYISTLEGCTKPELRFTGGWVRDKLLGSPSQDIDISISTMTGFRFGTLMKKYLALPESSVKYSRDIVGGLAKIEANPEKSKHLETITTRILGLEIDLVNLRKETYAEDSRNPTMEFGTPEDDAMRRDATVNALFYNLTTSDVEDFTGRGLKDMELKVIKTPLPAFVTFKDDPLRILRSIRFASRLGYRIDPEDELAMSAKDIRDSLRVKITRERVGTEISKMLKGPDPHTALCLIDRLGLYNTIFTNPTIGDFDVVETRLWKKAYDHLLEMILAAPGQPDVSGSLISIKAYLLPNLQTVYEVWLLCALVPWARVTPRSPQKPSSKAPPAAAATVAREGIKADNNITKLVNDAVLHLPEILSMKEAAFDRTVSTTPSLKRKQLPISREDLGTAIRRWGPHWRSSVMYAFLVQTTETDKRDLQGLRVDYASWLSQIHELGLQDAFLLKPIVKGKMLAQALGVPNGPWTTKALEMVVQWQLRNPDETDSTDAVREVWAFVETTIIEERSMDLHDLQAATQNHVDELGEKNYSPSCPPRIVVSDAVTLESVLNRIDLSIVEKSTNLHEDIVLVDAYLRDCKMKGSGTIDQNVAMRLQEWASKALLPNEMFAERSQSSTAFKSARATYLTGLRLLSRLQSIAPISREKSVVTLFTCLTAFTDLRDPWADRESVEQADMLLDQHLKVVKAAPNGLEALLKDLLREQIKPLFAGSKSSAITEQGRKTNHPLPSSFIYSDHEPEAKPWKFRNVYIVTVFQWVLRNMDAPLIEKNWPLIIPPLLTLIDDGSTNYKIRGCELLVLFLNTAPSQILERTGLGEVFQNALMPCLLHLPTLTPEEESLLLLKAVYPTLVKLVNTRYPGDADSAPRMKAFDQVFRYGILKGYAHAGEHVKIAKLLVDNITDLINQMGIKSIKHLKTILPILSGILVAPFSASYPPLVQASLRSLDAIILNDWPRLPFHRGVILEGLITCWCRIKNEDTPSNELLSLRESIEHTVKVLASVLKGTVNVVEEYQSLVDSDGRLQRLLVTHGAENTETAIIFD